MSVAILCTAYFIQWVTRFIYESESEADQSCDPIYMWVWVYVCVYSLWPHICVCVCVCVYFIYYIHIFLKKDMSSRTEKLNFLLLAMDIKIYDSYLSREYVTKYNDYYINRYLIANYSRYSLKGQIISWVRKVIASAVLWFELSIR